MASYINTNFASLQAQNNLSASQSRLQTSIARLSSGLRINSAADDAAGLAISDRMTAQVNGLNQAARNANDGISLAQTADGALASVSSDLQRIRQLAVQSANSTNSGSDRASLNQESQSLLSEISRVAGTTQFNGINLLDGNFSGQQFQVGANANQTINVNLAGATTTSLGSYGGTATSQVSRSAFGAAGVGYMTITANSQTTIIGGSSAADALHGQTDSSAYAKSVAINASASQTGVSASATTTTGQLTGVVSAAVPPTQTTVAGGTVGLNGVVLTQISGTTAKQFGDSFASAVNATSTSTGVIATSDTAGKVTLTAADGRDIVFSDSAAAGASLTTLGLTADTANNANGIPSTLTATKTASFGGTISLSSATPFSLGSSTTLGTVTAGGTALADAGLDGAGGNTTGLSAQGAAAGATTAYSVSQSQLSGVDLTTSANANKAISIIDAAISQVDSQRAVLGATSNRFQATISNLQTTAANVSSARSRIQDTDFAAETANLSQAQILQQAGTAMLTQANSLPNSVLTLLKG